MDELEKLFKPLGRVVRYHFTNTYDYRLRSAKHLIEPSRHSRRIAEEWKKIAPDVVHINKQNLEDGLDLLEAANGSEIPAVATIHMTQSARYLGAVLAGIRDFTSHRFLCRFAGKLVTVSENRKIDLQNFLLRHKPVTNIDNGICVKSSSEIATRRKAMRSRLKISDSACVIVSVGRLNKQKRPELFFQLAGTIGQREPAVHFIWVGDGMLRREMESLIDDRGVRNVMITGWTDQVIDYLAAADVYVHTADYEGLPFSLLEAMGVGLPCFVRASLMKDLPFQFDAEIKELNSAQNFITQLKDEDTLKKMGQAARQRVKDDYSVELMAEKYEQVYRSCLR
jgi:glycosyltransferase involved in cell wall biosynthesis